jgi:AcrR family transcriptional regulator
VLTNGRKKGKSKGQKGLPGPLAQDDGFYGLLSRAIDAPDGAGEDGKERSTRSEAREREILEAAAKVFAAKGYDGSRTREIAKEAGISEALMFRHFPSKEAILMAVVQPFIERFAKPVFLNPARRLLEKHADDPVEVILREVIRDRLKLFRGNQRLIMTLITEAARRPELLEVVRRRIVPEITALASNAIGPARRRGELRGLDDTLLLRSFLSLVVGYVALSELAPESFPRGEENTDVDAIVDLFLHGAAKEKKNG